MFASSWELCGINRTNSVILTLEMKKLRSRDDSDQLEAVFWLLIERGLGLGSPHIIRAFSPTHSVAVLVLLGCFWKNYKVFSLCILQIVHQLSHSCHSKDSPNELCISNWLKKEKSKDLDLRSVLTWKHTTSYMLSFSLKLFVKEWFKYKCETS